MSRLKSYIISEGRSQIIDEENALMTIKKYCRDAVFAPYELYRGNEHLGRDYYYWKSTHERISPHALNNIYNLLLSNMPSWKSYPKRNMSLVGSSRARTAENFGANTFIVLPFDGAKIGVCSGCDLWASFKDYDDSLDMLNTYLEDIFKRVLNIKIGYQGPDTYDELLGYFKKLDDVKNSEEDEEDEDSFDGITYIMDVIDKYDNRFLEKIGYFENKKVTMFECLNKSLDPDKNDFDLITIGKGSIGDDNEFWTDSECILVSYDTKDVPSRYDLRRLFNND
jgi:hypothetical protein